MLLTKDTIYFAKYSNLFNRKHDLLDTHQLFFFLHNPSHPICGQLALRTRSHSQIDRPWMSQVEFQKCCTIFYLNKHWVKMCVFTMKSKVFASRISLSSSVFLLEDFFLNIQTAVCDVDEVVPLNYCANWSLGH